MARADQAESTLARAPRLAEGRDVPPRPHRRASASHVRRACLELLGLALTACTTPPDVVSLPEGLEEAGTILLLAGDLDAFEAVVVDPSTGWTRPAAELVDLWIYRPVPASLGLPVGPVALGPRSAPAPDAVRRWSGEWRGVTDARSLQVADCPPGAGRPDGFCAVAACPAGSHDDGRGLCVRVGCADGFARDDQACLPICGDGAVVADETCDDGNGVDGDGCSARCRVESACDRPARLTVAHVDARALHSGAGTPRCPFTTIGAALASTATVVIVQPGTYRDERFPLQIRGVTLRGTDREGVRIVGAGPVPSLNLGSWGQIFAFAASATLLLGDAAGRPSRVEDLTLEPGAARSPEVWSHGVVCDRGLSPVDFGADFSPSAELRRVTIGPDYDVGVRVTSQPTNPALGDCSLSLSASSITGAQWGVWSAPNPAGHQALLGLVVDASALVGNRHAVAIWDRTARAIVSGNRFERGELGLQVSLHIDAGGHRSRIEVLDNDFVGMTRFGLELVRSAPIARLEGNAFRDLRSPGAEPAIALGIDDRTEPSGGTPRIARARRNVFTSNDVAIDVTGNVPAHLGDPVHDFGRPDDPGRNELVCSRVADLRLRAAGRGRILFAGNVWDHAPPTDDDLVVSDPAALPNVELADARTSTSGCP